MPLDEGDPKVRWATFGRQVEHFLGTDLGGYLVERAKNQLDEAYEDLKRADPYKPGEVAAAQLKARVADSFLTWLADAVAAGQSAMEELRQGE